MKKNSKQKERYFQNQHLHFTFCSSSLAVEEAESEDKIIIVGDNKKICKNDFVANKEIMENLFKRTIIPSLCPLKLKGSNSRNRKRIELNYSSGCICQD